MPQEHPVPHRPFGHASVAPVPRPNPLLSRLSSPCPCPTVRSGSRTLHSLLSAPWEEDEIRRDRVEPQSVSLSWREPIPAGAPGANGTEYEIRYYEKVSRGLGGTWGCIPGCDLPPSPAGFLLFISTSQQKSFLLSFKTFPQAPSGASPAGVSSCPLLTMDPTALPLSPRLHSSLVIKSIFTTSA